MEVVPYKEDSSSKKEQVAKMFDNISGRYDLLNRILSLGIDVRWRKRAVKLLKERQPKQILDIATGTADFAIESLKVDPEKVVGVDISEGMLEIGRKKIRKLGVDNTISLELGDSENLPFDSNKFDAVIVSFGVRNFENLQQGLFEIRRVLKNDGTLIVLEFSKPQKFPFKQIYNFYFRIILPVVGKLISKDNSAYRYLPESVESFPYGNSFLNILSNVGYKKTKCIPLTFGISSIYIGQK